MKEGGKLFVLKTIGIVVIFILSLYVIPIFLKLYSINLWALAEDFDGRKIAFIRSLVFALISSFSNILLGILIAIRLREIPLFSKRGILMGFLLIPVLIGNVSVAFIGKILFSGNYFFQQNTPIKFFLLSLIQFWQYGTMFIYLFWISTQQTPVSLLNYIKTIRLTKNEEAKDVLLPSFRNVAMLLFVLNFIFTLYEDAKSQLILKASRGTNTELIAHWLERNYQSNSQFNVDFAIKNTIHTSIFVIILSLFVILIATIIFNYLYLRIIKTRKPVIVTSKNNYASVLYFILGIFVLLPISSVFAIIPLRQINFAHLSIPFILTFSAAFISTVIAVMLGFIWRMSWKSIMNSFTNKGAFFFLILFLVQLFPPILLLISGFQWLKYIGYNGSYSLSIVWLFGHIILILPLLSSFITVTHYRVKNREFEFLLSLKIRYSEIFVVSFLKRFWVDYFLTFLIAFSLIWNESSINNVLSDFIPSFISEMRMSVTGRGTDYGIGMAYLFISVIIAVAALIAWKVIINRLKVSKETL